MVGLRTWNVEREELHLAAFPVPATVPVLVLALLVALGFRVTWIKTQDTVIHRRAPHGRLLYRTIPRSIRSS